MATNGFQMSAVHKPPHITRTVVLLKGRRPSFGSDLLFVYLFTINKMIQLISISFDAPERVHDGKHAYSFDLWPCFVFVLFQIPSHMFAVCDRHRSMLLFSAPLSNSSDEHSSVDFLVLEAEAFFPHPSARHPLISLFVYYFRQFFLPFD